MKRVNMDKLTGINAYKMLLARQVESQVHSKMRVRVVDQGSEPVWLHVVRRVGRLVNEELGNEARR